MMHSVASRAFSRYLLAISAGYTKSRSINMWLRFLTGIRGFSTTQHDPSSSRKKALILGSSGATGSRIARHLSEEHGLYVLGADVLEVPREVSPAWELDGFIALDKKSDNLSTLTTELVRGVEYFLEEKIDDNGKEDGLLDVIVCASGGWEGDPPQNPSWSIEQSATAYTETIDRMRRMNLDPVVAAAYLAQHYMNDNGLFVVIGAAAAMSPTPGMLAYGLAKAAAHHVVQTLGASTGKSLETKSVRRAGKLVRQSDTSLFSLTAVGVLPTIIDTPNNRKAMPQSDIAQWTKPSDIAKEIASWVVSPALRPHSGSLVKVMPKRDGLGGSFFELVR